MSDLEYDDVGEVDGKPVLLCEGRVVADFDQLLDAYESKCGDHRATLRLYTPLVKAHEELQAELSALRNSVRQKSVRATEQQLREVIADRDRLRKGLEQVCTYECIDSWHGPCGNCAYCVAAATLEPTQ